jgi:outer membrane protein assembly factor BamA
MLAGYNLAAQRVYELSSDSAIRKIHTWERHLNRDQPYDPIQYLQFKLFHEGYLLSQVQLDTTKTETTKLSIQLNKQFKWARLTVDRKDIELISQYQFRSLQLKDEPVSPEQVSEIMENLIFELENTGYPFASAWFDSVFIGEDFIAARLKIERGPAIQIDSIKVIGNSKISSRYLENYLQIKPGDVYSEKLIREIPTRVNELPFLKQARPAEVVFANDGTTLVLALDKAKANDFNGIIGFQPSEETGEVVITGDIHLKLVSPLGKGEKINLQWRRLQSQTQDIQVNFNFPYLFNTPIGIDAGLQIYRRDTSFSTITLKGGVQYALKAGDFIELNIQNEQSNLISTTAYENSATLPDVADITFLHYGLKIHSSRLDYQLNPRRGYRFTIGGSVGEKRIRENPNLTLIDYDSLDLTTTQYKTQGSAQAFIPILKKGAIQFNLQGGHLDNELLFRNELYRIGGLKSIRGFDEESIFASSYLIHRLELRWLLEQNSYTYVFYDQGWYEDASSSDIISDTPYGFGAGISFQTNAGIFSLNYALGSQFNQGIDYRSGKIHFGFVNYF